MSIQIIGKGGFAREVVAHFFKSDEVDFLEFEEIQKANTEAPTLIAIGDPLVRMRIACENKLNYVCIGNSLHDLFIGGSSFGVGTIICPGTIVTTNVKIGDFAIVNLNCTVGHDCKIGSFTTISPGVNISGNVTIGERCYIGTNAAIREGVTICDDVTIGMCAAVLNDITDPGTYVGVPAKKIK